MNADELRTTFLFERFTSEQLAWLVTHSEERTVPAGTTLFHADEAADALWVLLQGKMQLRRILNNRPILLEAATTPGSWVGWLPVFQDRPIGLEAIVTAESRLLHIDKQAVIFMLDGGFPLTEHLLNGLYTGTQNFDAISRQQEKLAALGKLSAGLAHELNNPAAAARRAALQFGEAIAILQKRMLALCNYDFGRDTHELADEIAQHALAQRANAKPLGPLEQSDREGDLSIWLEDHGIADSWEIAPTLVGAGIDIAWCNQTLGSLPAPSIGDVASWLAARLEINNLVNEVHDSTSRISDLVASIKSYTSMDRAGMQEIDIHDGLESTLTMMQHRLKQGVTVERNYDRAIPKLTAFPGELNQVWTNLIDNAIDAIDGKGTITITTGRDETCAMVEIADNGPGIPEDIQSHIFEPFFTTKEQGKGTGLGLDIAYRIVTQNHRGEIRLHSKPGSTRFEIWLPFAQEA